MYRLLLLFFVFSFLAFQDGFAADPLKPHGITFPAFSDSVLKNKKYLDETYDRISQKFDNKAIIELSNRLLKKPEIEKRKDVQVIIYNQLGLVYWKMGELETSRNLFYKSKELREELQDSIGLGRLYNNLGVLYWKRGDLLNAYLNYSKSLEFRTLLKDIKGLTLVLNNLGLVLQRLRYYDMAEENFYQALSYADSIEYSFGRGYSFRRLASLYLEKKDLNRFKEFADKALDYFSGGEYKDDICEFYNDYGRAALIRYDYRSAIYYFNLALNISTEINDLFVQANANYLLGSTYFNMKITDSSLIYINRSLKISIENSYKSITSNNYKLLSDYYKLIGDFKNSQKYLEMFITIKDSIFNESLYSNISAFYVSERIRSVEEKKKLLEKENEINRTQLEIQSRINSIYLLVIVLTFIFILVLVFAYRKLRILNKDLEAAINSKKKLLSIIIHDLKNPFLGISGFSELIKEELNQSEPSLSKVKDYSSLVIKSSRDLIDLIENLARWGRMDNETLTPNLENVNINEIIKRVVTQVKISAELKGITIHLMITDFYASVDREMIFTIFRNIISNAIKFSPKQGEIFIMSDNGEKTNQVIIKDSGPGIPKEKKLAILGGEEYESSIGSNNEVGTGLGLTLCRQFIKTNKLKWEINSEIGKGTEIKVIFPAN